MKNYLIVLLLFIISFFAFYFYIPTTKNLLCYSTAKCAADGASRQIANKAWLFTW